MGTFVFKMPDIGEGIVEAEVVVWHVAIGDEVAEDAAVADVMTDKATVEITAPVAGTIRSLGCAAGEKMVIGAPFVEFEVEGVGQSLHSDAAADEAQSYEAGATETPDSVLSSVSSDNTAAATTAEPGAGETSSTTSSKPKIRVVSDGELASPAAVTDIKKPATPQPAEIASQSLSLIHI